MIDTKFAIQRSPLEYVYALDALMPMLPKSGQLLVVCNLRELDAELIQRGLVITSQAYPLNVSGGVWIEPLQASWQNQLQLFKNSLPVNSSLLIVLSRPLARFLPECRTWDVTRLGLRLNSMLRLKRALQRTGFSIEATYGFHSAKAILLNILSNQLEKRKQFGLADRLHFAARMDYQVNGWLTSFSTVALLVVRKQA